MQGYVYIWEFRVRPGSEPAFLEAYGPNGTWVRLFRGAQGYLETVLLRDMSDPRRYVTVDRWSSEEAYRRFRDLRREEFRILDEACERLTEAECEVGRFALAE